MLGPQRSAGSATGSYTEHIPGSTQSVGAVSFPPFELEARAQTLVLSMLKGYFHVKLARLLGFENSTIKCCALNYDN